MTPTITLTLNTDGTAQIATTGYTGTACRDATAAIEAALGVVTDRQATAEANQTSRRLPESITRRQQRE